MDRKIYLSVVIPVYNEITSIEGTVSSVDSFLAVQGYGYEIITVDDGSTDDTVHVLEEIKKSVVNLSVLRNGCNRGKGYSVRKGMLAAKGEFRLFMDADNSTDISHVRDFIRSLEDGCDIVIGSRKAEGSEIIQRQSFLKESLGKFGSFLIGTLVVGGIGDTQCGFKCFREEFVREIFPRLKIDRWGSDVEMLALARKFGYKIKVSPVTWKNRKESRVRLKDYLLTLGEIFRIKINLINNVYGKK